jgi:hypothetical protein
MMGADGAEGAVVRRDFILEKASCSGPRAATATATMIASRQSQNRSPIPRRLEAPARARERFFTAISPFMIGQFDRPIESRYTRSA